MPHGLLALLLSIALALPAATAGADEKERYSEWRRDAAEDDAAQALARELEALIDEAERARAADPRFLQDLRDAIAAHAAAFAPRAALIRDDFSDGDFTRDPRWTVASGDFTVDPRLGLRTVVPVAGTDADAAGESEGGLTGIGKSALDAGKSVLDTGKDVVGGVLDAGKNVVGGLLGDGEWKEDSAKEEDAAPPAPEPAEIYLAATVGDAFALEIELTSHVAAADARFEIDLFQGETRGAGYRLSYLPGDDPALVLSRFGRRGVTAFGAHDGAAALEDGRGHVLGLMRDAEGAMAVSVDGAVLIRAESRAPAGPFDGIALVNGGGDYAIREIAVHAAPR